MDLNLQAKLLAYKAYRLGRESVTRDSVAEDSRFVGSCLNGLEGRPQTEETVRRRLFYTLILAELHRLSDPIRHRQAAMDLGEQLERLCVPNPFSLYMRVIAATTGSPTTGNFGDITTSSAGPITDTTSRRDELGNVISIDLAQSAIELSDLDSSNFDAFLRKSLPEIARLHGLA